MTRLLNIILAILLLLGALFAETGSAPGAGEGLATAATPPAQKVRPTKLGSRVSYLASVRGTARALPGTRQAKVIDMMERSGGALVTVLFDRALSFAELQDFERRHPIRFDLPLKSQTPARAVYSGVVPWNKLKALSDLPQVSLVETDFWPPPVPALDAIPSAKIDLAWRRRVARPPREISGKGL